MYFAGVGLSILTFLLCILSFGILYAIINTINSTLGFYAGIGICVLSIISNIVVWSSADQKYPSLLQTGLDQLIVGSLTTTYFAYLFYKKAFPNNSNSMSGGKRR